MTTDDKIKIIDLICQRHPSAGVEKGWSYYVGGMRDTGEWYFRKMLDADPQELLDLLNKMVAEERQPKIELTDEQVEKSKIYIQYESNGNKSWTNQLNKEYWEDYWKKAERDIFFGNKKDL